MNDIKAEVSQLRRTVTDEIFRVAGFSRKGLVRKIFGPVLWPPAHRIASIFADFDLDVATLGLRDASRRLVQRFVDEVQINGQSNVPRKGPLVVASNHPGTLDGWAIMSNIPRDDMKVVVEGFPFFHSLPATAPHLIFTPPDTQGRMGVVRSMISHLRDGGGILIFPSGKLDPDPQVLPGASDALSTWSPSLGLILKKVPQTQVMVTIVSGVLSKTCVNNPIPNFFDEWWMKLRVAEFIQVVQQILISRDFNLMPKISFGDPVTIDEILEHVDSSGVMLDIIDRARQLLEIHTHEPSFLPNGAEIKSLT